MGKVMLAAEKGKGACHQTHASSVARKDIVISSPSVATQSMVSGSGSALSTTAPMTSQATAVRSITYFNMDGGDGIIEELFVRMVQNKVYDMTYGDSDDDWCLRESGGNGCGGTAYFESFQDLTKNSMDKQDGCGGSRPPGAKAFIRGVKAHGGVKGESRVILHSGADLSVLPLSYGEVGTPLDKTSVLRDAQGRKMQGGKLRQALVVIQDDMGNTMCLRETFALSNVSCGWKTDEAGMD